MGQAHGRCLKELRHEVVVREELGQRDKKRGKDERDEKRVEDESDAVVENSSKQRRITSSIPQSMRLP